MHPEPDPHDTTGDLLPGAAEATARGCCCPVLANAAYRDGADDAPIVAPDCSLHSLDAPT